MTLKEELNQLADNTIKDMRILYDKVKEHPLFFSISSLVIVILILILLMLPIWQVYYRGINNATIEATLENQYRATLAQMVGGVAVLYGLYFAWGNLVTAREGQVTERFTRAIDQLGAIDHLGNLAIEIRLGGIYALERIANESDKDYWPIMEILTAYVRKNSPLKYIDINSVEYLNQPPEDTKVKEDIQAILTVIGERRYSYKANEDKRLNLEGTNLRKAILDETNLNGVNFNKANLEGASLRNAKLKEAVFNGSNLRSTSLVKAHLENAEMLGAYLELAQLNDAHLEGTILGGAHLNSANMREAHLEGAVLIDANLSYARLEEADFLGTNLLEANLIGAYLREAKNLLPEQLYDVKTLYKAELDPELEEELRSKGYSHLLDEEP